MKTTALDPSLESTRRDALCVCPPFDLHEVAMQRRDGACHGYAFIKCLHGLGASSFLTAEYEQFYADS